MIRVLPAEFLRCGIIPAWVINIPIKKCEYLQCCT